MLKTSNRAMRAVRSGDKVTHLAREHQIDTEILPDTLMGGITYMYVALNEHGNVRSINPGMEEGGIPALWFGDTCIGEMAPIQI